MKKPLFFLISVFLGVLALFLNTAGGDQIQQYSHRRANEIAVYAQKSELDRQHAALVTNPETTRLRDRGNHLMGAGLTFIILGTAFLVIAAIRREKGWYLIVSLLFVFDTMALLLV